MPPFYSAKNWGSHGRPSRPCCAGPGLWVFPSKCRLPCCLRRYACQLALLPPLFPSHLLSFPPISSLSLPPSSLSLSPHSYHRVILLIRLSTTLLQQPFMYRKVPRRPGKRSHTRGLTGGWVNGLSSAYSYCCADWTELIHTFQRLQLLLCKLNWTNSYFCISLAWKGCVKYSTLYILPGIASSHVLLHTVRMRAW